MPNQHTRRLTLAERFWPKVQVDPDGCWLWTGKRDRNGYGRLSGTCGEHDWFAHRLSWLLNIGEPPATLGVLHSCDNPPCVRPDHLFLGTQTENMADMRRKMRHVRGDRATFRRFPELQRATLAAQAARGWVRDEHGHFKHLLDPPAAASSRGHRPS